MYEFDALRGFSMVLVVMGHVLLSMNLGGYDTLLSSALLTFRMPLFFFVSGFFAYRSVGNGLRNSRAPCWCGNFVHR